MKTKTIVIGNEGETIQAKLAVNPEHFHLLLLNKHGEVKRLDYIPSNAVSELINGLAELFDLSQDGLYRRNEKGQIKRL